MLLILSADRFLWNARILWTRCSRFLFNSYRGFAVLVLRGCKQYIFSKEGCTQGSGCAMQAYAIGNLPLVKALKNPSKWIQNWYADDGSCLGELKNLVEWLKMLLVEGPKHGYYNEVSKMVLVVAPEFIEQAKEVFEGYGVEILTGHRILGGFIGSESEKSNWIQKKVAFWVKSVNKISQIAKNDPHSAFVAVSKSLQNEWNFIQRVVGGDSNAFISLKEAICQNFLPEISGFDISEFYAELMLRPSRFGGVGIRDPTISAASAFQISLEASAVLKQSILSDHIAPLDIDAHAENSKNVARKWKVTEDKRNIEEVENLIKRLPQEKADLKQHLTRITSHKCSSWLSANPWEDVFFSLTADEFRDSMACRYGKSPKGLQAWCDGCGECFNMNHALNCKNGGLVYQRHNELRDENCDLNKKAGFSQVISEPIVKEAGNNGLGELRGDWSVRGFWVPQRVAVFDTRIFNANAPSYKTLALKAAFNLHRNEKKKLYSAEVNQRRGSFTPIIATCEGILDREAESYVKRLAFHLSNKWQKSQSQTIFWVRARIQICILRSVSNCFRGSRTKWRGGNVEDGVGMLRMED